jgi:hypothetical protein
LILVAWFDLQHAMIVCFKLLIFSENLFEKVFVKTLS